VGWCHLLLVRVPHSQVFEGLLADRGGLLGQFGPPGGIGTARLDLQVPVGDLDLSAGPVGLLAPACPGRADAIVAIQGGFYGLGVMAPHGLAGGRRRWFADALDEIEWGVGHHLVDALRAGVVEGGVELSEAGRELLAPRGAVVDRLLSLLLVGGDGCEPVPEVAFGLPGLVQALLVVGNARLGGVDGVAVVAAPVAPAGFF
jgi:hypothetical protein